MTPDPGWPDEVPVLVGDDVLVSDAHDEAGDRRTLGRWASLAFTDPSHADRVLETLTETIAEALGRKKPAGYYEVAQPGDGITPDPKATPALMARAWNAAMRRLGYAARPPREAKPKRERPREVDYYEE